MELLSVIFTYLVMILTGFLVFVAVSHILYQKRSPSGMISWLLAVVLVPHLAVPLYFLIGVRKRRHPKSYTDFGKRRHDYDIPAELSPPLMLLEKNGILPATRGNRYTLISSDSEAFGTLMDEIAKARHSIDICTYVFAIEPTTERILHALARRAEAGVRVRLMLDTVGSLRAYFRRGAFREFQQAGGELLFFTPLLRRPFQSYLNLRNHRKIYLFDRRRVLSGGMNLSDEYMGPPDGRARWKDLLYLLEGPAVYDFYTVFMNDWNYASGRNEAVAPQEELVFEEGEIIQVVPSGPDFPHEALSETLLYSIYRARQRIWIVMPYFIPDDALLQALVVAAHRGVDVRLITPRRSNHRIADLGRGPYMRDLRRAGATVCLYRGEMLHAKAMLFDDALGMVGSLNLDIRSLSLNYEIVSFVYSPPIVAELTEWMEGLCRESERELPPVSRLREAFENLMKVFAPLL
ncbi:phospholipase D-like domain-containing protein [Nitratifractor sp.]